MCLLSHQDKTYGTSGIFEHDTRWESIVHDVQAFQRFQRKNFVYKTMPNINQRLQETSFFSEVKAFSLQLKLFILRVYVFVCSGVAYVGLQGKSIFPMVCSTAARSGMKVIRCRSFKTSLQFMCCQVLRKLVPHHKDVLEALILPPGLRTFLFNNVGWLLQPSPLESPDRCRETVGARKRNFTEMEEGTSKEASSTKRLCSSYRD